MGHHPLCMVWDFCELCMDTHVFSQPASAYLKAVGWIPLIALPRGVGELAHTGSKEPTVCIIPNSELSDHETGHGGSIYNKEIEKHYKSGLCFLRKLVVKYLLAHHGWYSQSLACRVEMTTWLNLGEYMNGQRQTSGEWLVSGGPSSAYQWDRKMPR